MPETSEKFKADVIKFAQETFKQVHAQVGGLRFEGNKKDQIAARLFTLCMFHCDCVMHLIEEDRFYPSVYALLRSCVEAGARSTYVTLCASDIELEKFEKDDKFPFPGLEKMVIQIRDALRSKKDLRFSETNILNLYKVATDNYSEFCSFSHGGMQQAGRIIAETDYLESGFTHGEHALAAIAVTETYAITSVIHLANFGRYEAAQSIINCYNNAPESLCELIREDEIV